MKYAVNIADLAVELKKIYNAERQDYPVECCKVELFIYPIMKLKGDVPKRSEVTFDDCKIRFKFLFKAKENSVDNVFSITLDVNGNDEIKHNSGKALRDMVEPISVLGPNPFTKEKSFKYYGYPEQLTVNLDSENADIKYNYYLNKAYKKCVERITGPNKQ